MKIELSQDSLFQNDSPNKSQQFRSKQRQKLRLIKHQRYASSFNKSETDIEVFDPLPQELSRYRKDIYFKKTHQQSKASGLLKKYIIEQERNLKRIRMEKILFQNRGSATLETSGMQKSTIQRSRLTFDIEPLTNKNEKTEEIHIPKIEEVFKDQNKQYVLYQSKMMRDKLKKAYNTIQNGINNVKTYFKSISHVPVESENVTNHQFFPSLNPEAARNSINTIEQYEVQIDKIIEKKLILSKKLQQKLYKQKREMHFHESKQSQKTHNPSFFLSIPKKPKRKVLLEGVKSITISKQNQNIKVTQASSLLFSINKISVDHDHKQDQLHELVQNSYLNRDSTLQQKSDFYDKESQFSDLSPSNQFKLRRYMDKALLHKIELSKQQINKFCKYLNEIKAQYHVILSPNMLELLKQIRQILLTARVMKKSDLTDILTKKKQFVTSGYPNQTILRKLNEMMI